MLSWAEQYVFQDRAIGDPYLAMTQIRSQHVEEQTENINSKELVLNSSGVEKVEERTGDQAGDHHTSKNKE